jgi:hypothetical protein
MRRLLLSVAGGFVIPFLYSIITGPLSLYIESERIKHLLWIPIGWPKLIYFRLITSATGRLPDIDDNTYLIIAIVCNVALYGALTYLYLLARSLRKPKTYPEPPPPPTF